MRDSDSGPSTQNTPQALAANNRQQVGERAGSGQSSTPDEDDNGDRAVTAPDRPQEAPSSAMNEGTGPKPAATGEHARPELDGITSVARGRKSGAEASVGEGEPQRLAANNAAPQSSRANDGSETKSPSKSESAAPEPPATDENTPPEPEAVAPSTQEPAASDSKPDPDAQSQEKASEIRQQPGEQKQSVTSEDQTGDRDMADDNHPQASDSPEPSKTQSQKDAATADTNATAVKKTTPPTKDSKQPPATKKPARLATSAHVSRAQLTSGIRHKEPVDRVKGVFHSERKSLRHLYYFTEIKGLRGATVTHNWWHNGRRVARVSSYIGSNSWRMYSGKKLIPSMVGRWRVVVTDNRGKTLSVARFTYKAP